MNELFHNMFNKGLIIFINNILIYRNGTKLEYKVFVYKCLDQLLIYRLGIVIEKYEFPVSELLYLRYILSSKEV